jgi:ABC-2 type transport system permease protein
MLPMIFIVPIFQMLVLVYAATMEMKHINMYVVDHDMSQSSRQLISKFEGSPFYFITGFSYSIKEAEEQLKNDETDVILQIPVDFEKDLTRENRAEIQLLINAINGMKAGLINAYSMNIISQYNQNVITDLSSSPQLISQKGFDIRYRFWFNPELNFKFYMLPGILVILVTIMGMFLSALSMVREKELGTIEQINVTPIRKYQFLAGKLFPFWVIGLFELAFGLIVGKILFKIPIEGSLLLLFGFSSIYLFVALGISLFFSTITSTQQQVMFVFFFFNIVFILMSGLFTPVESMPEWAQKVNYINPLAYFMRVIRMIMLKGSGLHDILKEILSLSVYAIVILSLAIWRYRKTA